MQINRDGTELGLVNSFTALRRIRPLRGGVVFSDDIARHLHSNLKEIANIIGSMPVKYMRWPGSNETIFRVRHYPRTQTPLTVRIYDPFLWSFGELHVPLQMP
jgi:hypothetical protein